MGESYFKIYNASAGSGKTFTLVKEYLKIVLASEHSPNFRQILAVTFTNKAVNEMKERILDSLFEMSKIGDGTKAGDMALSLHQELGLEWGTLQRRSDQILKRILHNYAFFDVSTIDKFTHRVIRTFAKDLKLSQSFEVVLDTDILLEEAIDNLLSRSGEDPQLTAVLVDFALDKTDEDKHWNVAADLQKIGKMLFRENDMVYLQGLENRSIQDFIALQKRIKNDILVLQTIAREKAGEVLELITTSGKKEEDFPRRTLPAHFKKIIEGGFDPTKLYGNTLEKQLRDGKIVKVNVSPLPALTVEAILNHYLEIKRALLKRAFLINILKNLVPLTVLQSIQTELKAIELQKELLPITSFNSLISEIIGEQPAPFIYERLGEKYRHYFIDEFQDTSQMQWHNLIPLVGNALESLDANGNPGSLLIVGDAKQAIYRWRGGKPEQFLGLIERSQNPFSIEPSLHTLEKNYRSAEQIIEFNNDFFEITSSLLGSPGYRRLFLEETRQETNSHKGGLVQIEFIDCDKEMRDQAYLDRILEAVKIAKENNYLYQDICVLIRKKKQGVLVSQGLINEGIPVVSSETLLLKNSPEVMFLIGLLRCKDQPDDQESKYLIADYLIPKGPYYHRVMLEALANLDQWLIENWGFDIQRLSYLSVYDGLEEAITIFGLVRNSDAYIAYLMDEVLLVEQMQGSGINSFLDHWEKKIEKLSITLPENINAIKIMTIHKAKGLEFPIVIYPYANSNIYEERGGKIWQPVDPEQYNGFSEVLLSKKKQLQQYGESTAALYIEDQQKLELDSFNVLYVALTRAVDGLFILSEREINEKGEHTKNLYSTLLKEYLMEKGYWADAQMIYSLGHLLPKKQERETPLEESIPYIYSTKEANAPKMVIKGTLWDEADADPRKRGTLVHYIMSLIEHKSDLEPTLSDLLDKGTIKASEINEFRQMVLRIVNHQELKGLFQQGVMVKNEQEIITENGLFLRPDRLVFNERQVTIIDYKTGARSAEHRDQLLLYGNALKTMGYELSQSIIVYINDTINIEYIQ
ncbi:MAG: UvrD-helicase domain-containing protein [Flavobacteriaceae bacterium]